MKDDCVFAKQLRSSFPVADFYKEYAGKSGEFFHVDVYGPMSIPSMGGPRYFVLFKDDRSAYRFVYPIPNKFDVFSCFLKLEKDISKDIGAKVCKLRTNWGGEFLSKTFAKYMESAGIVHEYTAPYTPEQNGRVKREN
jgi:hypothetical protein